MRRRFGRGRRGRGNGAPEGRAPIDAERALGRIVEAGIAGARSLERLEDPDVPDHFAVLGLGEGAEGRLLVGFAPQQGGDAALAVLSALRRLAAEGGFDGEAVAVAPQWSGAARRRLALLATSPLRFRALAASDLADDGEGRVEPERDRGASAVTLRQAESAVADPAERELFARATASLEGLAAKHGGSLRGTPEGVELVLLARRCARLRSDAGLLIETLQPDRSTLPLHREGLANALDRLEGMLRKRLNDHRVRDSEEGLRGQLVPVLAARAGLRGTRAWPLPGSDPEVIDLAGIAPDGVPVVGAVRQRLGLVALAPILDAVSALRPALAMLLADAGPPLRLGAPRLALAAAGFDAAVERVLPLLALETALFDVRGGRGREPELEPRAASGLPLPARAPRGPEPLRESLREAEGPEAGRREPRGLEGLPAPRREARAERAEEPWGRGDEAEADRRESRSRRRRGRRRPEAPGALREAGEAEADEAPEADTGPRRFDEISLFDLEDERSAEGPSESGGRRRRRGRRRRGRRGGGGEPEAGGGEPDAGADDDEVEPAGAEAPSEAREAGPEASAEDEEVDDDLDLSETLAALSEDVPDLDEVAAPSYDEDEEEEEEEPEALGGAAALRQEREARRQARVAQAAPLPEPAEAPRAPRRRAALVAHADRDSILAAVLLARDLRLVEGLWVYPQSELMTFFRSVATDLREETPICVVGFTASPARDTIQAASLYAGRLDWYDHHDWPPEDLEALRAAVGRERVVLEPGTGSSLTAVLASRTRRSRFSDKLVELAAASFSQHDYERWGRLWWHRLGETARRTGERRADLEPLLVGRPSELAREAARHPAPDPPPELDHVARHDFRLVHFGGYVLVVVPVPAELDLHLTARVARERYGAALSLAWRQGSELLVLAGGESRGRRDLDLGRMVQHLAAKHRWIEALSDADFVARLRVRDLGARPERLDEVIGEVAMGRSIFEG